MEGIWILLIFTLIMFVVFTFTRKFNDSFVLIAFAIGTAVNANYFHGAGRPIEAGGMIFGVNSILYTFFMFTVAVKYLHYPVKEGKNLVLATEAAIILAALFELVSNLASGSKIGIEAFQLFGNYVLSAIGTLISCTLAYLVINKLEEKHVCRYLTIAIVILIGTTINSTIYFLGLLANSDIENELILQELYGNFVCKAITITLCEISYLISSKWWVPNSLTDNEN